MEIFKNASGYVPLLPNLEGHWDASLAELPSELRTIVEERFPPFAWDCFDSANRRNIAAQSDYNRDPRHEPGVYFELSGFAGELKDWIEKARQESKDAAVVVLRDVADRIEKILDVDRERVGLEIQSLREVLANNGAESPPKPLATRERRTLLTIIASLCKYERLDPKARGTAQRIMEMTDDLGAHVGDETILKMLAEIPGALESRMK